MTYTVTLIPGDGIGPELSEATVGVLEATGIAFAWEVQQAGESTIASEGTPLPERGLAVAFGWRLPVCAGWRAAALLLGSVCQAGKLAENAVLNHAVVTHLTGQASLSLEPREHGVRLCWTRCSPAPCAASGAAPCARGVARGS